MAGSTLNMLCSKCQNPITDGEHKTLNGALLCEDCYIATLHPSTGKPHYKHDKSGFMRRLKKTHSVVKQEID